MKNKLATSMIVTILVLSFLTTASSFAQTTASVTVTSNYLWRGLTQSMNEAAVQGGIKYNTDSGAYIGTWASNVAYDPGDVYSYEHDIYFGFGGTTGDFTYDLGYQYYNYDENAGFDFGEVYGTVTFGVFSLNAYLLTNAEPDEGPGQNFSAFETFYLQGNLAFPLVNGATLGLHTGYHEGDWANAFNGVTEGYIDYNINIAKDGFILMVSSTDLDGDDDGDGFEDYANMPSRDNDEIKFLASYTVNFEL